MRDCRGIMLALPKIRSRGLRICTIDQIITETPTIKTFRFKDTLEGKPGQFVMVWIPGVDEIPMSLSYLGPQKGITVTNVGEATAHLHQMKLGDKLGIRGPYGNGFNTASADRILAVAGGCGNAPIAAAVEKAANSGKEILLALGARTQSELLFVDRMETMGIKVDISTDDGSAGHYGYVINRAAQLLTQSKYDLIITCGPEPMMKNVVETARAQQVHAQASLERYMKCGIGICTSCAINGFLVCSDGPVFDDLQLTKLSGFGQYHRDACRKVSKL